VTKDEKEELNALAGLLYKMHGYNVIPGFDFSVQQHPQEKMMFELAKVSKQFWAMKNIVKEKGERNGKG